MANPQVFPVHAGISFPARQSALLKNLSMIIAQAMIS